MHRDDPHTPPPRTVAAARPAPTRPTGVLWLALLVSLLLLLLVLACGNASVFGTTSRQPYVACPTPSPRPFGVAGPRKPGCTCLDGTTECADCMYTVWEQEGGSPPEGRRYERFDFAEGEPITIEPLRVRVRIGRVTRPEGFIRVRTGELIKPPPTPDGWAYRTLVLQWHNPTTPTGTLSETMLVTPTMAPAGPVSITYESAVGIWVDGTFYSPSWEAVAVAREAARLNAQGHTWDGHPIHYAYGSPRVLGYPFPDTIPMGDRVHELPILVPSTVYQHQERADLIIPYLPDDLANDPAEPVTLRIDSGRQAPRCVQHLAGYRDFWLETEE
jgi:hypothetical protein